MRHHARMLPVILGSRLISDAHARAMRWRSDAPGFLVFLSGQSVSFLGSQVTRLALPLTAVLLLQATPSQMGFLGAANDLPFLIVGLVAGVLVDRVSRRYILIAADFGRALLLVSIPMAAWWRVLTIEHLYLVSFFVGGLSVVAFVASQAFVPSMAQGKALMGANSMIEGSASVAQTAGPGLAGLLVKWLGAPIAIAADALSFVVSALCLVSLKTREAWQQTVGPRQSAWRDISQGIGLVLHNPLLRSIVLGTAVHNFVSNGMIMSLYVLFATRQLHMEPTVLGAVLAAGGPGAFLGALAASQVSRRIGLGHALIGAQLLTGLARCCITLAALFPSLSAVLLGSGEFLLGFARPVFNINQVTLRQLITPDHLQGRMNASIRFLIWAAVPGGAVLAGLLAERVGMFAVLAGAALGTLAAAGFFVLSPLRPLRDFVTAVPSQTPSK